jgi:hypothetical protein
MNPALGLSHACDGHRREALGGVWSVLNCALRPPAVLATDRHRTLFDRRGDLLR